MRRVLYFSLYSVCTGECPRTVVELLVAYILLTVLVVQCNLQVSNLQHENFTNIVGNQLLS